MKCTYLHSFQIIIQIVYAVMLCFLSRCQIITGTPTGAGPVWLQELIYCLVVNTTEQYTPAPSAHFPRRKHDYGTGIWPVHRHKLTCRLSCHFLVRQILQITLHPWYIYYIKLYIEYCGFQLHSCGIRGLRLLVVLN